MAIQQKTVKGAESEVYVQSGTRQLDGKALVALTVCGNGVLTPTEARNLAAHLQAGADHAEGIVVLA